MSNPTLSSGCLSLTAEAVGGPLVHTTDSLSYVPKIRSVLTWASSKKMIVVEDNDPVFDDTEQAKIINLVSEGKDVTGLVTETVDLCNEKGGAVTKVQSDVSLWVQRMTEAKNKNDDAALLVANNKREEGCAATQAFMHWLPTVELAVA